jgi:hypothetical protein
VRVCELWALSRGTFLFSVSLLRFVCYCNLRLLQERGNVYRTRKSWKSMSKHWKHWIHIAFCCKNYPPSLPRSCVASPSVPVTWHHNFGFLCSNRNISQPIGCCNCNPKIPKMISSNGLSQSANPLRWGHPEGAHSPRPEGYNLLSAMQCYIMKLVFGCIWAWCI